MEEYEIILFDGYAVDLARGELRLNGDVVSVEPQVLELIAFLASHPGVAVTRDELIEHVWKGRIVSDSAIATRINAARSALGDDGQTQRLIKTLPRRGFRFEGKTRTSCPLMGEVVGDKPTVAVLPFRNLSGDAEQAYFSDGITDDIIIELARCRDLNVIARQSSFIYRDASIPLAKIAEDLQAQYILEGGVRRAATRIRVTAHLLDPKSGAHLWVERYDRDIADIFEVQDEITSMIVNTLTGEITRDRYRRSLVKSVDKVNAYDRFLRASELNYKGGCAEVRDARVEAMEALAIDPSLARAHALVAWTHVAEFLNAWGEAPSKSVEEAKRHALAAVEVDNREPLGYAVLGWVHMCTKDFERAFAAQQRAIEDNPGNAHYRSLYAFTLAYAGQSELALQELEEAMRLNPRHPDLYNAHYGRALFNLRRYSEAIAPLEKVRTSQPGNGNALALVAACYAALERMEEAAATIKEVRLASPNYTLKYARENIPFARKEDLEHYVNHLASAGL